MTLGPDISLRLNTLTSIAVRSTPDQPRIELISGEALIDVAMSTRAPLVLIAGAGDIRARRAKFYARCIDGHTSVTCLTGSLEVGQGAHLAQLSAGQQIAYSPQEFDKSNVADLTQATAWESGMLVFRDATLAAVVAEINRYRPGRIVVVNAQLAHRIVNATFHVGQLDNFLLQAKQLFGAKVTALPGGLRVSRVNHLDSRDRPAATATHLGSLAARSSQKKSPSDIFRIPRDRRTSKQ